MEEATSATSAETPPQLDLLDALQDELLSLIISHLPLPSVAAAFATCHRINALGGDDEYVWRAHLCRLMETSPDDVERAQAHESWRGLLRYFNALPKQLVVDQVTSHTLLTEDLSVRFTGRLGADRAVRADAPIPKPGTALFTALRCRSDSPNRVELSSVYYFEVAIASAPLPGNEHFASREPCVSIGLATSKFLLRTKQVGWDLQSIGWHGDDGVLYHNTGLGLRHFGPRFGAGDTVGCGVHLPTNQIFFTHNGSFTGWAFRMLHMPELVLYAAVGIDSHQALELNFGAKPFLFDPSEHLNIFQGSMPVLPVAFTRVHEEAGQAPWGFAEEIEWDDDDGEEDEDEEDDDGVDDDDEDYEMEAYVEGLEEDDADVDAAQEADDAEQEVVAHYAY